MNKPRKVVAPMPVINHSTEFSAVKEAVCAMGEKTRLALEHAVKALTTNDLDLADNTKQIEKEVDSCLVEIEKNCLNVLTTRQFDQSQIVFLVNSLRIAVELERVCDYSNQIAKIVLKKLSKQETTAMNTLHETVSVMGNTTIKMLNEVLCSYETLDALLLVDIKREDKRVNKNNKEVFRNIVCISAVNPWVQEALLDYYIAVRYIERVGDQVVNIARLVYDIVNVQPRE